MSWFNAFALAVAGFAAAAFALRIPRGAWVIMAATMLFGLAGYAFQAHPALPGAPHAKGADDVGEAGWNLVELRQSVVSARVRSRSREIVTADAMVRHGQFENAATLLNGAVKANPGDYEAWLAMGNALVEHGEGNLTPAALYAWRRAQAAAPGEPGPAIFMGFLLVRQGKLVEAHQLWSETLDNAPPDAPWRDMLAQRIVLLEQLMRQIVADAREGAN